MKLRIRGNSLRLRLSQNEVSRFALGETIAENTLFSADSSLSYSLFTTTQMTEIHADLTPQGISVKVPLELVKTWAHSNQISLTHKQVNGSMEDLFILIEKDFVCLKPRDNTHEDESDLFTNPNKSHGQCGHAETM